MNKNVVNILLVFIFIFGSLFFVLCFKNNFNFESLTTDSGFDSSFGGGSSGGSSGGFSGGSSSFGSSSGSSSGGDNELDLIEAIGLNLFLSLFYTILIYDSLESIHKNYGIIFLTLRFIIFVLLNFINPKFSLLDFLLLCILCIFFSPKKNKEISNANVKFSLSEISLDCLRVYGIMEDSETLKKMMYDSYVKIQKAWSSNNIDRVRDLLSDEIYNTYKMQIMTMIQKNERNEMSDFEYVNAYINNIDIEKDCVILKVSLNVLCKDYMINASTNEVIRGNKEHLNSYYYVLTFRRYINVDIKKCPNCHAPINSYGSSVKCNYCGSNIVKKSSNFVLIDKKMAKQKIIS